jgi:sigma-E factor negative regulatory protein RseB
MFRLLLLICLFISGAASSNELWLKISEASKASQDLNYSGIINTTDSNQDIQLTKMIHVNHEGEEFLKIEKIDGADNLLLMYEADAVIYDNDQNKILIKKKKDAHLFPNIFPSNLDKLKDSYSIGDGGDFRVAGRATQMLVLSPIDENRYNYHLWLDKESHLPLKMMVIDNNKKVVENIAFANIEFLKSQDISWFRPNINNDIAYSINENKNIEETVRKFWTINDLPSGFEEVSYSAKRYAGLNAIAHQIIYSDGLSYISIFIHPVAKNQKPQVGSSKRGSSNIHAEYKKGYQILAVGAVPMQTLSYITNKVKLN